MEGRIFHLRNSADKGLNHKIYGAIIVHVTIPKMYNEQVQLHSRTSPLLQREGKKEATFSV